MNLQLALGLQIAMLTASIAALAVLTVSETALLTYKRLHATSHNHRLNHLLLHIDHVVTLLQLLKYLLLIISTLGVALISRPFLQPTALWQTILLMLGFTLVLVLFAELIPRKLARLYPEKISFACAQFYSALLTLTWPCIVSLNSLTELPLKLFKHKTHFPKLVKLSGDELQHLVEVEGVAIPTEHLDMLTSIVDLESTCVEDIMTPRSQLVGINLAADWADVEKQVIHSLFTRIMIYEDSVDNILGFVHLRRLLPLLAENKLDREHLRAVIRPAYFIPEGTSLIQQLLNFREQARRSAIVVDEYGDILGMLALEDILEEIVGEFSTAPLKHKHKIQVMADGSVWLDGKMPIRELNQLLNLNLPVDGPKTINGLIMDHLESLPVPGMTVLIDQHPMEIRTTRKNAIKTLIIYPAIQQSALSGAEHGKN